jgi:HAD superfamily hydrolase (TIGR01549 family)
MLKLIIFDLDGVIFDTEKNMKLSWKKTQQKHGIKKKFSEYKKYIGLPFFEILNKLEILYNHEKIQETYTIESLKRNSTIKLFRNVKKIIKKLNNNYLTAVVTSKDLKRTSILIKKYKLSFNYISCPTHNLRGKPYPDQINLVVKKMNIKKSQAIYVGDTKFDFLSAKSAKIKFIHAAYGFEKKIPKVKTVINSFNEIVNKLND